MYELVHQQEGVVEMDMLFAETFVLCLVVVLLGVAGIACLPWTDKEILETEESFKALWSRVKNLL